MGYGSGYEFWVLTAKNGKQGDNTRVKPEGGTWLIQTLTQGGNDILSHTPHSVRVPLSQDTDELHGALPDLGVFVCEKVSYVWQGSQGGIGVFHCPVQKIRECGMLPPGVVALETLYYSIQVWHLRFPEQLPFLVYGHLNDVLCNLYSLLVLHIFHVSFAVLVVQFKP